MYLSFDGPMFLKIAVALAGLGHHVVGLLDHLQGVVVADGDALGAALALGRVDDDLEHAADAASSSCRRRSTSWSSTTAAAYMARSASGMARSFSSHSVFGQHLAEDGGVGALGHAVHAAGAVRRDVLGDFRGDVAEVAQRGGAGGDQRAGQRQVGGQVLLAVAFLVAADDALVEVDHVQHRQADQLVTAVDQGAVGVVVEGVALAGLVHRRLRGAVQGRSRHGEAPRVPLVWNLLAAGTRANVTRPQAGVAARKSSVFAYSV